MTEFKPFPKIARLNRDIVVTEKIDGTNASVTFDETGMMLIGSRNRFITVKDDNFGFAKWCTDNYEELLQLGVGTHFGEWWGKGIQRGYGMDTRKFSLFNTGRWYDSLNHVKLCPACCDVVPILYMGPFDQGYINNAIDNLADSGSVAAPGFKDPEGVVVYHTAANLSFKVTCENDEKPKGQV